MQAILHSGLKETVVFNITEQNWLLGSVTAMLEAPLVVAVDVGTGSTRAGIFTSKLRSPVHSSVLLGSSSHEIKIFRPRGHPLLYEQSSEDIWNAVGKCVKEAIQMVAEKTGVSLDQVRAAIKGIGFDATCSLVVLGAKDLPLPVSPQGASYDDAADVEKEDDSSKVVPNIILWLDHRARQQAKAINETGHRMLGSVGGKISPENEIPKMKWLKQNLPDIYSSASKFLDLADFLTYRASGQDVRSLCTLVCKWVYDLDDRGTGLGWDRSFFKDIGLEDLSEDKIGRRVAAPGGLIGTLTAQAAEELGLDQSTKVAVGIVDAHGGGIGCIGATIKENEVKDMSCRMALIAGTSTCHLVSSESRLFVPGVWGPFFDAMAPGLWLNEAGQSATGALLDFVITTHPSFPELKKKANKAGQHTQELLQSIIVETSQKHDLPLHQSAFLTADVHVLPHFAGCRSPLADPDIKGMVTGLSLDASLSSLASLYLATIQALAYGTRHIIDAMHQAGHPPITDLFVTGGLGKNALFVREHADATACRLILPQEQEGVLLGSAMLAATACKIYPQLQDAMQNMAKVGSIVDPSKDAKVTAFHQTKYTIYHQMTQLHYKIKEQMGKVMGR